jgi:hypothetical protein
LRRAGRNADAGDTLGRFLQRSGDVALSARWCSEARLFGLKRVFFVGIVRLAAVVEGVVR